MRKLGLCSYIQHILHSVKLPAGTNEYHLIYYIHVSMWYIETMLDKSIFSRGFVLHCS